MLKSMIGLVVMLLCCSSAYAQQTQRGQTTSLREIIPGHYMFSSGDLNSGIIVTSDGVVVFDALDSEAVARTEREAIANTIRQPIRFLVSSPHHNPFSKGNIAYADVWKIGHENYRTDLIRQMERDKASPEEQKARLPKSDLPGSDHALPRRQGDSSSLRRSRAHAGRQHRLRPPGSHCLSERGFFRGPVSIHERWLWPRLAQGRGDGRRAWGRNLCSGTQFDARRPQAKPRRVSALSANVGGCSRFCSASDCARRN
jgi:hypothetical protein